MKLLAVLCLLGSTSALAQSITPQIGGGISKGFDGGISGPTGSAAPVAWTPLNLGAILVEWWDASSLSATPVASWTGKKLGTVATALGTQPTWSATARNGKPGVTFVASSALTFVPTGFPSGAAAGGISVQGLSSTSPPITNGQFAVAYGAAASTAGLTRYIYQQANVDVTPGATAGGTSGTGDNVTDTFSWANADRFVVFQISGQNATTNTDGNTAASATMSTTTNTSLITGAIGSWPAFGNTWVGPIQQVYITSGILSTNARQCLEGFDSYYVGLAGANLATANPYSSTGTLHRAPLTSDNCT